MSVVTICDEANCQEIIYREPIRLMHTTISRGDVVITCPTTEKDFCSFECLIAYAAGKT